MPYRQARGTLMIDLQFPKPIGRIQKASGTSDTKVHQQIVSTLRKLHASGKHEILQQLRRGEVKPLHLLALDLEEKLSTATSAIPLKPLSAVKDYVEEADHLSPETKRGYLGVLNPFLRKSGMDTKIISDIPDLLATARRETVKRGRHHRSFNLLRSVMQSYLANDPAFGKGHPLYHAVRSIKIVGRRSNPLQPQISLSYADVMRVHDRLKHEHHKAMLLGLYYTGMRKGEYLSNKWNVAADRINIAGTKTVASVRFLPRVFDPIPARGFQNFEKTLRNLGGELGLKIHPHILRHSYAHLLSEAGVPKIRRKIYMGRVAATDVQESYEVPEIREFLKHDTDAIKSYIAREERKAMPRDPNEVYIRPTGKMMGDVEIGRLTSDMACRLATTSDARLSPCSTYGFTLTDSDGVGVGCS